MRHAEGSWGKEESKVVPVDLNGLATLQTAVFLEHGDSVGGG